VVCEYQLVSQVKIFLPCHRRHGGAEWQLNFALKPEGQVADTRGYGEEPSSSINAGNFLTSCKVYWLASQEGLLHGVSKELKPAKVLWKRSN
jgi:hypothetical protein